MSLAIDIDKVTAVLLADGWHDVACDSFDVDSYEFVSATEQQRARDDFTLVLGGGQTDGVCATGFSFQENPGVQISGPLTSILAVRERLA